MKKPRQLKTKDIPKLRRYLLKKQRGLCLICCNPIKEGEAVLDHHHKKKVKGTGRVRGVLCRTCNVFLAKSENNCKRYKIKQSELPFVLRNMAKFLERKQLPYIHPSEAPKKQILKKSSYNKIIKAHTKSGAKKKIPEYRCNSKGKPVQGLTKALEWFFIKYEITPEFYK